MSIKLAREANENPVVVLTYQLTQCEGVLAHYPLGCFVAALLVACFKRLISSFDHVD